VTLCSVAAIALAFSPKDKIDAARYYIVEQGREGISEFSWSVTSLPREVTAAGEYVSSNWRRVSTQVAFEARSLKHRFEAEISSNR
jgi:hypothetical protein